MKIVFEKSNLNYALTPAMSSVSSKNIIPATAGILVKTESENSVSICSYDLEKGMRTVIPANVIEEGCYVINAVKLNQIVKTLPDGEILIEVDEKCSTKISSGRSEFCIPALPGNDFPSIPELSGEIGFKLSQKTLRSMISRTLFAIAQTDQRPIYCGAYFEIKGSKLVVVSCDSYRLAYAEQNCNIETLDGTNDLDLTFIVPGKTLVELMKFMSGGEDETVTIKLARKHAVFEVDDLVFFTRLLEGQYIEYNRYIPKDNTIFVNIDTTDFMNSLERAALISEEKSQTKNFVKCSFKDNLLVITANAVSGNVYDEVMTEKEGNDIEICFTCRYLLEALRACNVDKIKLSMSAPLRAMLIEPANAEDEKFLFVTLPTRMK